MGEVLRLPGRRTRRIARRRGSSEARDSSRITPVEKLYRDAKIGKIYEGTSFMQLATIAKLTLGKL